MKGITIDTPKNKGIFATMQTIGASNYREGDRSSMDFYATEPKAVRMLLELEKFEGPIWECACGMGHLSEEIKRLGYEVYSSDIVDRGYGNDIVDFLGWDNITTVDTNIITNPPFALANEFILRAMDIIPEGRKVAFFMPTRYLEGRERGTIYKRFPPKTIYVSRGRLACAAQGDFAYRTGSAMSFAWYVWQVGYNGDTILKWFN